MGMNQKYLQWRTAALTHLAFNLKCRHRPSQHRCIARLPLFVLNFNDINTSTHFIYAADMKKITVLAVFLALGYLHQAAAASWLDKSLDELKKLRGSVENRKADLLFLLDTSGSLSLSNFNTEKKFIRNLLNVIAVGFDATRVEIITFGSDVNRRVPFISEAHEKDTKCTFNEKFANVVHEWGMTNMRGAFEKAYEVCKGTWSGKKRLNIKTTVILITDGHWNWPWQNPDPVPKAQQLIREGVEILAFGVGYGISLSNLQTITANQRAGHTYAFQISNFDEFNKLATYLRGDPYQKSKEWAPVPVSKCRGGCDVTAKCTCGLVYGDYKCSCPMGRKGSGTPGDCTPCGHDTYKSYEGFAEECTKCPKNSGHQKTGQTHISECKCKRGYTGTPENGNDCTIRHCADIKAPDNGDIEGGSCNTAYGSTCKLKCKQGFKETGAKTINCVYKPDTGEVVWDKPATMCQVITCPSITVGNSDNPNGQCKLPNGQASTSREYQTVCVWQCSRGYRHTGDLTRTCQVDGQWSGTMPVCSAVMCKPLPSVNIGNYHPPSLNCDSVEQKFDQVCSHRCPSGYHMSPGTVGDISNDFTCNFETGEWDGQQKICKDFEPPTLTCPSQDQTVENDPGQQYATVDLGVDFNDNSLKQGLTKKESFKVVLKINKKEVDASLTQHKLPIRTQQNEITYNVTDPAGNENLCNFRVRVNDVEPPTCSRSCPPDIIKELTTKRYQPIWDIPICTDNDGIPPRMVSSRQISDHLDVPGIYAVTYDVSDQQGNKYNCSFQIRLTRPQCKAFAPPKNGASQCFDWNGQLICSVSCRQGNDFVFEPAMSYLCSAAIWNTYPGPFGGLQTTPWPDCSPRAGPSKVGMMFRPMFFFNGDCNEPDVQQQLKSSFLQLMGLPFIPPGFCKTNDNCKHENLKIACGEVDVNARRKKRSGTKQVYFQMDYVKASPAITGADDLSEQALYVNLKNNVDAERPAIENGLKKIDWGAAKLTLDKLNLKPADAYCSDDGAVVRKCSKNDLLYTQRCRYKDSGEVTRCIRCPIGTYYEKDQEKCINCPEGSYMNHEGALECKACPDGTWTFGSHKANFTNCQAECGPGYFSATGIARCYPCKAGEYSSGERNKKCEQCPKGTTSVSARSTRLEDCGMKCAPGTYSSNGVEPCTSCPIGSFQNATGGIACRPCPGRLSTHGTGADDESACVEVNDCASSPCNNNAKCIDTKESYRCECLPGFQGANCDKEVDECDKQPCFGAATCVNRVNGYSCLCPPGFVGTQCDTPVKVCSTQNPCVRGTCVEQSGGAHCSCPLGFEGAFCELNVDECASNPCQNNAVCVGGVDKFQCICRPGFSGTLCQFNDDDCSAKPCRNGGSCIDNERFYTCACPAGYTGKNCETEVQECQSEPCQHGGTCTKRFNGYECSCAPTYTGANCEKALSSDYDLTINNRASNPYAATIKKIPDLTAFSVSLWVRSDDEQPGTALSYSVENSGKLQDGLVLQDFGGLNLFINDEATYLGVDVLDGFWHHVAVTWSSASGTWKAYIDGRLVRSSSSPFQIGQVIRGGGVMLVGQEQDELGGGFNAEESFVGDLSQVNVWSRVLSDNEIFTLAYSCVDKGDVVAWADFRERMAGAYTVTPTSYACRLNDALRYFTLNSNTSIPQFNDKTLSSTTPQACASACDRETGFKCRSFDFDKISKTCYLSRKHSADNLLAYDTTGRYNYYEMNCQKSMGVDSNKIILDSRMTASSYSSLHLPKYGRLHKRGERNSAGAITQAGAWCAGTNDAHQWLQIDLNAVMRVSGVATQGREDYDERVTFYKIEYSVDNTHWTMYPTVLTGNTDQNTIVRHEVSVFRARYIRFRPQAWYSRVCLRAEVYGCPDRLVAPNVNSNDCSSNPCRSRGQCVDRLKGYSCNCFPGYSGPQCSTVVPCSPLDAPVYGSKSVSGNTVNFSCQSGYQIVGSSSRSCTSGQWTGTQPRCEDQNECSVGNHRCAQLCINTPGSYNCACAKGYRLDNNNCIDINECSTDNGGCSHSCHNTAGGVKCSCPGGMALTKGQRTCVDVNECAKNNGGCQHTCVNTHRSFKCLCNRGFSMNSNGRNCDPLSCPALPSISLGQVSVPSQLVGALATYTCNAGYRVIGSKTRTCQADTTWSGINPSCERIYCREVGTVKNSARMLVGYSGIRAVVGSVVRFTCNSNHAMGGAADLVCQRDGTWSAQLPRCIPAFCSRLQAPTNGQIQGFRYELGATLRVTCSVGYNLVPASSSFRTCEQISSGGGRWTGTDPICQLVDCGDPGSLYGGSRALSGGTKYQAVVTWTCLANHHLQGKRTQTCQEDGEWSGTKPFCLKNSCGYLDPPANGKKIGDEHNYGKSVTFECDTGYRLKGSKARTCQNNGLWDGTQPTCEIVNCGDPGTPANGMKFGDKLTYQSVLTFECDPGFRLSGTIGRQCQADGTWSGSQPSCSATSCGQLRVGPAGVITSQNYPNNYRDYEYCTWEVRVPADKKVRLDFNDFKTVENEDVLLIYDTGSPKPIITYHGSIKPFSFTSSGRSVRIRFISDGQNTMKGFKISYRQIDPRCGGVLTTNKGVIQTPNFPDSYDSFGFNLDCVWLISRPNEKIELMFSVFDTQPSYDKVFVYKGYHNSTENALVYMRTGPTPPVYPSIAPSHMWVQLKTDYASHGGYYRGFKAQYYPYNPYFQPKKK